MLQGIRLVAADDDSMSLEMLTTILGSQGVLCTAVANGREAMDALELNPDTDIVLLDLQMPVMDGFEVLLQCKGNPYLCDIPVMVLAADHNEKLKSLKLGADDFMAKPYDLEELELRILKLVQSRRQTQSAKRAKNEFLAIAGHELRAPMLSISGLAGRLDSKNLIFEQRELVEQLKHATGNLTALIKDILNYVQLDQGAASASLEPFSLRATVQDAIDSHPEGINKKKISYDFAIDGDVSDSLNGPSFYVSKVFNILIENAVKFTAAGKIRIAVREESFGKYGSRFCCSVSDPGIGVLAALQEKIFEPFVHVDASNASDYEDIGLGLAIAKRMIEMMGGTISVENDPAHGSSFSFSFHCHLQMT